MNDSGTSEPRIPAGWLPALVAALLCLLVAVLWWTLDRRERAHLYGQIDAEARHLAARVETDLRDRIPALERLAHSWETRGGLREDEFLADARAYMSDVRGFQALEWVDSEYRVRWIVPLEGNQRALDANLASERTRRDAIDKARETRTPAVTTPIDLIQGGKGFLIFVPVFSRGQLDGFILAVFRVREWLDYALGVHPTSRSEDFRVSASFDDTAVFEQPGWEGAGGSEWTATARAAILDHRLTIRVRPTARYVEANRTPLPALTAVAGGLLSGLVAFIVYLLQRSFVEAWRSLAARAALEAGLAEHQKTKQALQHAVTRLDMATKAGGIGVWTWDRATGAMTWNERMFELFDVPPDVDPTYETWRAALHPDDRPPTEHLLEHAASGKGVFNTEFRVVLTSGLVRYLGTAARMERDHAGQARGATGITWDVTARREAEDTVKRSEERVRLLLDSTAEAIYGIDMEGNCTFANASCLRMLGYARTDQVLGRNMHTLIHHSHASGARMAVEDCSIYRAFREGARVYRNDEVLWRADGTSFPAEYWSYPQLVDGRVSGAVVTFNDITERRNADALLAEERRRLGYILEGTNVGTWEWNVQTGEATFNERWAEMVGYTLAELAPVSIKTWTGLGHPADLEQSQRLLERHFAGQLPYYECEARMRHKDGSWIWVLDRGKVATWTEDGRPLLVCGTHQEITARKRAEEEIHRLATHDLLTDLPSLKLARDRLAMALGNARRHQTRVAVMFIDLDGFKAVNDTLGHHGGDHVLRQVAGRLLSCVRSTDTVARVGGDEFILVATDLHDARSAATIAEKLVHVLSQPITFGGSQAQVGASVGIAVFPDHGGDMEDLIRQADAAMYRVKSAGKNAFGFSDRLVTTS